MRLVVTGGSGFIGSHFVRHWIARHPLDQVTSFIQGSRDDDSNRRSEGGRACAELRVDITNRTEVMEAFEDCRPDAVVHLAGQSHNSRSINDPTLFFQVNMLGTQILLEAARQRRIARFHFVSTGEVYGDLSVDSVERWREGSAYRPTTPYNASKIGAEIAAKVYHEMYKLPVTISNSCNNYGPWQHPEKLVPLSITNHIEGIGIPLFRSSHFRREWMHVEDHCYALESILLHGSPGEAYNIGSGEERSAEEIVDTILQLAGGSPRMKQFVDDRPGHGQRFALDSSKMLRQFGWRCARTIEEGLAETVDWYRHNDVWWRPLKREALLQA